MYNKKKFIVEQVTLFFMASFTTRQHNAEPQFVSGFGLGPTSWSNFELADGNVLLNSSTSPSPPASSHIQPSRNMHKLSSPPMRDHVHLLSSSSSLSTSSSSLSPSSSSSSSSSPVSSLLSPIVRQFGELSATSPSHRSPGFPSGLEPEVGFPNNLYSSFEEKKGKKRIQSFGLGIDVSSSSSSSSSPGVLPASYRHPPLSVSPPLTLGVPLANLANLTPLVPRATNCFMRGPVYEFSYRRAYNLVKPMRALKSDLGACSLGKPIVAGDNVVYPTNGSNCLNQALLVVAAKDIGHKHIIKHVDKNQSYSPILSHTLRFGTEFVRDSCRLGQLENSTTAILGLGNGTVRLIGVNNAVGADMIDIIGDITNDGKSVHSGAVREVAYDPYSRRAISCDNGSVSFSSIDVLASKIENTRPRWSEFAKSHYSSVTWSRGLQPSIATEDGRLLMLDTRITDRIANVLICGVRRNGDSGNREPKLLYAHERIDDNLFCAGFDNGEISLIDARSNQVLSSTVDVGVRAIDSLAFADNHLTVSGYGISRWMWLNGSFTYEGRIGAQAATSNMVYTPCGSSVTGVPVYCDEINYSCVSADADTLYYATSTGSAGVINF